MEITREQFVKEINELSAKETRFNVSSSDTGSLNLYLQECVIKASEKEGIDGECLIYKPQADMEVTIDFNIVDMITKQNNTYTFSFRNGLADVDIAIVQ